MDSPPNFLDRHCDCFDDDMQFFQKSFQRKNPKPQVLTKVGDNSFFKLSKKVPPTWNPRESHAPEFFDPIYKATLCYYCYLNESDGEEGDLLKIRPMKLSFHLDDETFSLYEPITDNSGHIQGRQFHRQRIPRNPKTVGTDYLDWKDVHVGEDLVLFGRKYRIVGCDDFTKNFLEDRGIHVDDSEPIPTDAWSVFRHFRPQKMYRDDELTEMINKASLETELPSWETLPMNLIFHVAWLDSKNDFHGTKVKRTFRMIATPADDTVTLIETTPGFNNQVFLKGLRLSYLAKDRVHRFYRVANFRPGIWIDVFKRPMYIYDCEGEATKAYIRQQFGTISYGTLHMEILERGPPAEQFEILPNELMFKATNDEFPGVKFLILYNVNKRKIDIFEESRLKQWAKGRTFLLDIDATSMSLETLKPGSILRLFKWDFKLGDANEVTAKFIKFTEDAEDTHNVDLYNDD